MRHSQDLVVKLLQREPASRLTLDEALAHPFLAPYAPQSS